MLTCEYDERNQCTGCKLENNSLKQIQDHIRDLLKLINMAETDLNTIDKIQRFIDNGLYEKQRNIFGDPITRVSDVANYPPREEVAEELDDLRYELKLYRRKEFELIKEVVNKL